MAIMSEEQIDASIQKYGLRPVMKKRIGLSSRAEFMAEALGTTTSNPHHFTHESLRGNRLLSLKEGR
jgi:hypothetical protein